MKKLRAHVFICTNERPEGDPRGCCKRKGSEELLSKIKQKLFQAGLSGEIRAQKAGCLDACEEGVSLVIYPDNVWYGKIQEQDLDEIIESHLKNGRPVERLKMSGK